MCASQLYAQGCLRTLCVASRTVGEELWEEWSRVLTQAAMAMRDRDDMLERLYSDMECELTVRCCCPAKGRGLRSITGKACRRT